MKCKDCGGEMKPGKLLVSWYCPRCIKGMDVREHCMKCSRLLTETTLAVGEEFERVELHCEECKRMQCSVLIRKES